MSYYTNQAQTVSWIKQAFFYHIFPIGFTGAPERNDLDQPTANRFEKLYPWIDHWLDLGVNALYIGPLFQSSSHGYDTIDYFKVDHRLGTNEDLANFINTLHSKGIKVVLDCVFNHVGREFWAFKDVLQKGKESQYCDWFEGLNFEYSSPVGDPFTYNTWNGIYDLVKLNLKNDQVKHHLKEAARFWIREFNIDGLRMDAAEDMNIKFLSELSQFCKSLKEHFWMMGEVIFKDYTRYIKKGKLDSITNYEVYKGIYSSLNDGNLFEIAYSLKRQFGEEGIYKDFDLYNFVDNHDVNRLSSMLKQEAFLYPAHILLFTIPGVPSIYYGSEWGIPGKKNNGSDAQLRPSIEKIKQQYHLNQPDLAKTISILSRIKKQNTALTHGAYREILVDHNQLAFERKDNTQTLIIVLNTQDTPTDLVLTMPEYTNRTCTDLLNQGEINYIEDNQLVLKQLPPNWGKILKIE